MAGRLDGVLVGGASLDAAGFARIALAWSRRGTSAGCHTRAAGVALGRAAIDAFGRATGATATKGSTPKASNNNTAAYIESAISSPSWPLTCRPHEQPDAGSRQCPPD